MGRSSDDVNTVSINSSRSLARLPSRSAARPSEIDPFEDQREVSGFDGADGQPPLGREARVEPTALQTLDPHGEAVAIPVHDPDAIAPPGEEHIEVAAERVLGQR